MEIQSLKVVFTEEDLNHLLRQHFAVEQPVRDLKAQLTAQGILLTGSYALPFFSVPFKTRWDLSVAAGCLAVRLAGLEISRMPVGRVRGEIMKMLASAARPEEGIQVQGDTLSIDLDRVLQAKAGLMAQTRLRALQCEEGKLILQAGM
jgi:hypothetical protein